MNSRFEKLRKKLDKAVEVYGVNSKETKKISKTMLWPTRARAYYIFFINK